MAEVYTLTEIEFNYNDHHYYAASDQGAPIKAFRNYQNAIQACVTANLDFYKKEAYNNFEDYEQDGICNFRALHSFFPQLDFSGKQSLEEIQWAEIFHRLEQELVGRQYQIIKHCFNLYPFDVVTLELSDEPSSV